MPTIDPSNPLGLLFIASFAVQQILEALSAPVEKYLGESWKKTALGVVGFVVGLFLASQLELNILTYFIPPDAATSGFRGSALDTVLTALVLSAGTEGTNSVLKYLKYLKEDKKVEAASTVSALAASSRRTPTTVPVSPSAVRALNKLRARAGVAGGATADAGRIVTPARALSYISDK
jgi:hypothetical protein